MKRYSFLLITLVPFLAQAGSFTPPKHFTVDKYGLWETSITKMDGLGNTPLPQPTRTCVTAENAQAMTQQLMQQAQSDHNCNPTITKDTSSELVANIVCTIDKVKATSLLRLVRTSETKYETQITTTMNNMVVRSTAVTRYVGPCT